MRPRPSRDAPNGRSDCQCNPNHEKERSDEDERRAITHLASAPTQIDLIARRDRVGDRTEAGAGAAGEDQALHPMKK